ncbi:MAG: glycosyltransferase, partial [Cyanobacteria bacterium P01_F01_bin.4]
MENGLIALLLSSDIVPTIYLMTLSVMAIYGAHKILLIWRFYKYKSHPFKRLRPYAESELPRVTVQLPIFNEIYVAERLLTAVSRLNYPADKLEIQVLDDSTDETRRICHRQVKALKQKSLKIDLIHRQSRVGFKAGALENGLKYATGELVIIFDADFMPTPDTLLQMVDYFADPEVGMVQARWAHINRHYSLLTEIQALMLDGHSRPSMS